MHCHITMPLRPRPCQPSANPGRYSPLVPRRWASRLHSKGTIVGGVRCLHRRESCLTAAARRQLWQGSDDCVQQARSAPITAADFGDGLACQVRSHGCQNQEDPLALSRRHHRRKQHTPKQNRTHHSTARPRRRQILRRVLLTGHGVPISVCHDTFTLVRRTALTLVVEGTFARCPTAARWWLAHFDGRDRLFTARSSFAGLAGPRVGRAFREWLGHRPCKRWSSCWDSRRSTAI